MHYDCICVLMRYLLPASAKSQSPSTCLFVSGNSCGDSYFTCSLSFLKTIQELSDQLSKTSTPNHDHTEICIVLKRHQFATINVERLQLCFSPGGGTLVHLAPLPGCCAAAGCLAVSPQPHMPVWLQWVVPRQEQPQWPPAPRAPPPPLQSCCRHCCLRQSCCRHCCLFVYPPPLAPAAPTSGLLRPYRLQCCSAHQKVCQ
jgi:hypothetical protein